MHSVRVMWYVWCYGWCHSATQHDVVLPRIQSQISGMFCYFLSYFLCCRTLFHSSIHEPSPTSNPRPAETTPLSLHLNPSAIVTSTPIAYKTSGVDNHSSTKIYWRDANICLAREMENRFCQLMLPGKFLNKYLPLDDPKLVCPESNWPEIRTGMKEVGMYSLFVSITPRSCQPAHTEM